MNNTELYIKLFYEYLKITEPHQLTITNIAEKIDLPVHFWEFATRLTEYAGEHQMFLNEQLNDQEKWQAFGHEMCHYSWHNGSQQFIHESFATYQEQKANYFAYHFCVPSFMLEQIKINSIRDIMNLFNVNYEFAVKRFNMHENKMLSKSMVYLM